MIFSFRGREKDYFLNETQQMFRLRAHFFAERSGWNVKIDDDMDKDSYDDLDPLYILCIEQGVVVGALRLLPTTGPTLLNGPLTSQFDDCVDIRSPHIVECSKFVVDQTFRRRTPAGVSIVTANLLMTACDFLLHGGVRQMIGMFDTRMLEVYRRAGWAPTVVARNRKTPGLLVGLWTISGRARRRMALLHGIGGDENL